jgi:hypothetical protein
MAAVSGQQVLAAMVESKRRRLELNPEGAPECQDEQTRFVTSTVDDIECTRKKLADMIATRHEAVSRLFRGRGN